MISIIYSVSIFILGFMCEHYNMSPFAMTLVVVIAIVINICGYIVGRRSLTEQDF